MRPVHVLSVKVNFKSLLCATCAPHGSTRKLAVLMKHSKRQIFAVPVHRFGASFCNACTYVVKSQDVDISCCHSVTLDLVVGKHA